MDAQPKIAREADRAARARYAGALAVVLAIALALRLWGIKQGLPYVYNTDEYGHFVPESVAMFAHGLDPHYFINPPAFTYLLHALFAVWFGGGAGASREFASHPDTVYLLARVTAALLGTVAVWLLYLVGARLFSRAVGLLAALIMAVAFLPVFYSHLALNDVPTLVPLTLSLLGAAGVLRRGRALDYLIAGAGVGLAAATKYTAGIVIVALLAAALARYRAASPAARRAVLLNTLVACVVAMATFVLANPYSVLDFHTFSSDLNRQSEYAGMSQSSWVGGPRAGAFQYYLWSFTWGLGWIPAFAALGGAITVWRRDRWVGWVLVPMAVAYLAFMSLQGRYFGRWLLPILPVACLLAAYFTLELADRAPRRTPRLRRALPVLAALALAAQGAIYSIHSGLVLSRPDTRNITRTWMVAHVPIGTPIVLEPVVPNAWLKDIGGSTGPARPPGTGVRWVNYPSLRLALNPSTGMPEPPHRIVLLENYERTLGPALIPYYESHGYCLVVSGVTQSGRAFANPPALPGAIAYYHALARQGEVLEHVSPYAKGNGPVPFGFDWTFDYYPLAYDRPGPEMTVYRLRGGRCGRV